MRRRVSLLACLLGLGLGTARAHAQTPELSPGVRAALEAGIESPELRELREAEERMFGAGASAASTPDVTATLDTSFLAGAVLPDMPARWDDAVVRYLQYFRDDTRGRALMRAWYQRANRYDASLRATLRESGVPEDLRCVALAESGFDPTVRSGVGALGMWQFMPETGRQYGMNRDRWIDERMDPTRSTRGAARYLRDLQRRFGSWELALAAYNMGYGSLLRAIRKYNTNDFAVLSRIEAGLPFETTVYVSKIVACGIVLRNPERFGLGEVARDAPIATSLVSVPGGVELSDVARVAGVDEATVRRLNPHLLLGVVPPNRIAYDVAIPASSLVAYESALAGGSRFSPHVATLRFGERLDAFAARFGVDDAEIRRMNRYGTADRVVGPVAMIVPHGTPRATPSRTDTPITVPVPATTANVAGRTRVFYAVIDGDTLDDVAAFFEVPVADLATWNDVDAHARLQTGMVLQVFAPSTVDLSEAIVLRDDSVHVVTAGTDEFFDWYETQRGRVRVHYRVEAGDTLGALAARFGLTIGDLARINRLPRNAMLRVGQDLVVYTSRDVASNDAHPAEASATP